MFPNDLLKKSSLCDTAQKKEGWKEDRSFRKVSTTPRHGTLWQMHMDTQTQSNTNNQNKHTMAAGGHFSLLYSLLHRQMRSWPPTDNLPLCPCIVVLHHLKTATVKPGHFSTQSYHNMGTELVRLSVLFQSWMWRIAGEIWLLLFGHWTI